MPIINSESPSWVSEVKQQTSDRISTFDDSSITSNLESWAKTRSAIQKSQYSGKLINAQIVTTINSFFANGGCRGAVLSSDGSLFLLPRRSTNSRAYRLTPNGVVTTFTLLYNTFDFDYWGGVLGPEGAVHMNPHRAAVGQCISLKQYSPGTSSFGDTITVSTYPLAYTGTFATENYTGAVVGNDGTIHYIPFRAPVGQKITVNNNLVTGVSYSASTYSLLSTSVIGAYMGGVLAPDGSIHMVPYRARVGQKIVTENGISTAITYSLIYTVDYAYNGGAIDVEGSIHFAPLNANIGQKVLKNGTVVTYPLIYTGASAYSGGALLPDGSIHFIPFTAPVGQKVDVNGTVSTYSIPYTTASGAYNGGVLGSDGSLYCVPYLSAGAVHLLKINVVSGYNFNRSFLISPYLNKI